MKANGFLPVAGFHLVCQIHVNARPCGLGKLKKCVVIFQGSQKEALKFAGKVQTDQTC